MSHDVASVDSLTPELAHRMPAVSILVKLNTTGSDDTAPDAVETINPRASVSGAIQAVTLSRHS